MAMVTTTTAKDLYWEAIGGGPAVLLVPGSPGYGGQFAALAEELARDRLVIVFDRRGTARSGRPEGWSTTSVQEQAHDAAAVLEAVGVTDATVFGTSNGAMVALELAMTHPRRVRQALLHEMPLVSVLPDPGAVAAVIGQVVGPAMESGGPAAALEAFLRFAYGDDVVDSWPTALREPMLGDAEMIFTVELPAFQAYRPEESRLRSCPVPIEVLVGVDEQVPFFRDAAEWLALQVGTEVRPAPGAHGPHFTAAPELADAIRRLDG